MPRLLLALCLLLGACGYHFPGQQSPLAAEVREIRIQLFANGTAEPFLENRVTEALVARIARSQAFRVAASGQGDAVLSGSVTGYSTTPISYDRRDRIREYRSTMAAAGTLTRSGDGKVLWRGSVSWSEEYPAGDDLASQEFNESQAIRVLAERLAEELYYRMLDDF